MSGLILATAVAIFVGPPLRRIADAHEVQARAWALLAAIAERGRRS